MAQTPLSSATAYCTVDPDWTNRSDRRVLCQLASDTDTPIASDATTMNANARLLACLLGASGELEAAVMEGQRYTPLDLAALTGASQALLYDLVCKLALIRLFRARPDAYGPRPSSSTEAMEDLEKLRRGLWVLGFLESKLAGNIDPVRAETAYEVEARNGEVVIAQRFFGRRANRRFY